MSVNIDQLADGSMGLTGKDGVSIFDTISIQYSATTPLAMTLMETPRACIIEQINAVVDAPSTNAVTASVYWVPSGTALASGTLVHSGTINLQGAANTNQTLVLTPGATVVPAGAHIGIVISGAIGAAGNGSVSLGINPA